MAATQKASGGSGCTTVQETNQTHLFWDSEVPSSKPCYQTANVISQPSRHIVHYVTVFWKGHRFDCRLGDKLS